MKNQAYRGKKIAIFTPFYFGYQNIIYKYLCSEGAFVYLINENVNEFSLFHRLLSVYNKNAFKKIVWYYYCKKLKDINSDLDYVLIIKGSYLEDKMMLLFKEKFRNAFFVMYQWDSIEVNPNSLLIAKYCDLNLTFDSKDAKKQGWTYRPLFFYRTDDNINTKDIDVTFVCSLHSKRADVYKQLLRFIEGYKLKAFCYLYTDLSSYLRQRFIKRNPSFQIKFRELKFTPLNSAKMSSIYGHSKCVIDYKFPSQEGLTMRTIESIGYKCKLITNNINIKDEDFYNPSNIYIYKEDNFYIPQDFINAKYCDLDDSIYAKYSIAGWCKEVFGIID